MANQQTLKVAIVGLSVGHAGTIGPEVTSFLHNFKSMEGVEVVAYCEEQKPEILKDADIHHPEASQYDSVVLTPRDLPGTALKLAEAGKHMFLDKQFSRTAPDLIPVVKAVRKSGVKTFLGYPWSYHPAMHDLKRMIDDGVFGKPLDIECRQVYWKVGPGGSDPDAVANRNDTEGGGVLHYVGCHHLELMRHLMGCEVKSVQAMTGRPVGAMEEPLEDIAILAWSTRMAPMAACTPPTPSRAAWAPTATIAPWCTAASRAGPTGRPWAPRRWTRSAPFPSGAARPRGPSSTTWPPSRGATPNRGGCTTGSRPSSTPSARTSSRTRP
jgi:hypothetical protein